MIYDKFVIYWQYLRYDHEEDRTDVLLITVINFDWPNLHLICIFY